MIYLLRHGLDDEHYIGGWSNGDLLEEGKKQVKETSLFIKNQNYNIQKIYSSDITRAITSSYITSDILKKEVILDSRLRELNKGLLTGLSLEEAKDRYPEFIKIDNIQTSYPEGESMLSFYYRIQSLLQDFILKQDNILLVTHRGVINMLYFLINNEAISMDKKRFKVTHASLHELNPKEKTLVKIK